MPEKPDALTFKQTLKMRRSYVGKSCKLHFEVAPLKIVKASRQYMYDDNGNTYLDCINNTSHVGHCHPHVMGAGQEQMSKLVTCYGFLTDIQVEYAQRIVELLPENLNVCYFLNSGSEVNDLAIRLARAYTKNNDIICVDHAYHGNTENLIQCSPSRLKWHNIKKEDWVHVVPCPDTFRGMFREDSQTPPGILYANEVKTTINSAMEKGKRIAAFLSEMTMVNQGVIVPPPHYFQHVYRCVREAGGICIADEVQTGLGRCGDKFWAFQSHDVVPDIVTMGKPLGNGYPMAIVVTTKEISDSLKEFSSAFGGNPVACAMGMAVLDVVRNEKLISSANSVGKCLIDGFRAIMPKHSILGDVRGMGLCIGVDIVLDKESRKPNKDAAELLVYSLKGQKILINNDGPEKNVITFLPPMCFTIENARTVIQAFDKALGEIEEEATKVKEGSSVEGIEVPLSILTSKHKLDSDEDDEDESSPSKRQKVAYEEMD